MGPFKVRYTSIDEIATVLKEIFGVFSKAFQDARREVVAIICFWVVHSRLIDSWSRRYPCPRPNEACQMCGNSCELWDDLNSRGPNFDYCHFLVRKVIRLIPAC